MCVRMLTPMWVLRMRATIYVQMLVTRQAMKAVGPIDAGKMATREPGAWQQLLLIAMRTALVKRAVVCREKEDCGDVISEEPLLARRRGMRISVAAPRHGLHQGSERPYMLQATSGGSPRLPSRQEQYRASEAQTVPCSLDSVLAVAPEPMGMPGGGAVAGIAREVVERLVLMLLALSLVIPPLPLLVPHARDATTSSTTSSARP